AVDEEDLEHVTQRVGGVALARDPDRVLSEVGEHGPQRPLVARREEAPTTTRRESCTERREGLRRVPRGIEAHRDELDPTRQLRIPRELAVELMEERRRERAGLVALQIDEGHERELARPDREQRLRVARAAEQRVRLDPIDRRQLV